MSLDAEAVAWLLTPEGSAASHECQAALAEGGALLAVTERLRRSYTAAQARWAVTLAEGRRTARGKFEDADRLYFDTAAAEQATNETVARHTAERFTGAARIADLGCGAGADAIALARHGPVLAIDADTGRCALAEANAAVRDVPVTVVTGDLRDVDLEGVDAVWLDPARRDASGRVLDPERWSPSLSEAIAITRRAARAGIKVAPGIDLAAVPLDSEVEFISLAGRLVEAVIWLGETVTAPRRATMLPARSTLAGEPDTGTTALASPGAYLYDLDPAVGRAGLVDVLAPRLGAWLLAPDVAYLSSDEVHESTFARRYRILDWFGFAERRLVAALREAGAARVEVMRRASPVDTNALERRLNGALPGGQGRVLTVALTRAGSEHIAIVCERDRD